MTRDEAISRELAQYMCRSVDSILSEESKMRAAQVAADTFLYILQRKEEACISGAHSRDFKVSVHANHR